MSTSCTLNDFYGLIAKKYCYFCEPMKDSFKHKGMRNQLAQIVADKGITDEKVLNGIRNIPRHLFMDSSFEATTGLYKPPKPLLLRGLELILAMFINKLKLIINNIVHFEGQNLREPL